MKRKLLFAALCACAWVSSYAVEWTDKTSLINNPSFETDEVIANLTTCGWASDRVTGWTITPSSASNAQIGVGNSSSTLQGIGSTFSSSAGDKFFYTRNNWNKNTTFTLSQTITAGSIPAGLYKVTCKTATFSSDAAFNTLTISLKEGTNSPVSNSGIVMNVWNTWGVILFKQADDTDLTITMTFKPGYEGNSKHYAVLLDDFHLEFIAAADAYNASADNTIDFSAFINNAGIYNHSTKGNCPRGWTSSKHTTGNGNYTEGEKGDTRLEGWSGSNLDIDYNQTITNLPAGTYTVTAAAQERAKVGRTYVYASTDGQDAATGLVNNTPEYDVTTDALKVTNGTMKIGIKSTANDWVTADNFRISFLGFDVDAVKGQFETLFSAAKTARDNTTDYSNIVGVERTNLVNAITTYTTSETQSYGWYLSAINALETAISNFTDAKTNYDALVAEIANAKTLGVASATADSYAATSSTTAATALTNIQSLNELEYTAVTTKYNTDGSALFISSWDNDNFGSLTVQHWSGEAREYFDKWSASAFTSSISKTVTLPEGHYAFYAAGRGQVNSSSAVTLKVAYGETEFTQAYAMKGDTGKGIATNGEANFGEGTFANGGAGRGWEWRYIVFDLDAETEVTLSIVGSGNNSWVGACDTKLLTYNNVEVSRRLYNANKETAEAALANSDYENITGSERTDLQSVIAENVTATYEGYNTAAANLATATANFTAVKDVYDTFAATKSNTYAELPYASSTKYDAISTAQEATDATSASDAVAKTAAIISAYRKYVESNALAEGVDGAEAITVRDYRFANVSVSGSSIGAWSVYNQTGGNVQVLNNESFTDGDGNADYSYVDIAKNDNNYGIKQTINLEPGMYLMTVTARCRNGKDAKFEAFAGGVWVSIPQQGNSGGQFGKGWNDVSVKFNVAEQKDVEIGVKSDYGKDIWWSATRFRLVRIGDAATMSVKANKWGTFVAPFDVEEIPEGIEAYTISSISGNAIELSDALSSIPAKTPVILKNTTNDPISETFYGDLHDVEECGDDYLKGVFTNKKIAASDETTSNYVLQTKGEEGSEIQGFYKVNSEFTATPNRCYLTVPASSSVKAFFFDDGETAIQELVNGESVKGQWYNLSGQRVNKAQKGIYIINGKKVVK